MGWKVRYMVESLHCYMVGFLGPGGWRLDPGYWMLDSEGWEWKVRYMVESLHCYMVGCLDRSAEFGSLGV